MDYTDCIIDALMETIDISKKGFFQLGKIAYKLPTHWPEMISDLLKKFACSARDLL